MSLPSPRSALAPPATPAARWRATIARAVLPYALIAAATSVLRRADLLSGRAALSALVASALAGVSAGAVAALRYHARLLAADAWIAHNAGPRPADDVLATRSAGLVAARHRRLVAATLRRFLRDAARSSMISSRVRLDAAAIAACAPQLRRAAERLADVAVPVAPRAVALAEELITRPDSPVYRQRAAGTAALEQRLHQVLFELERAA